MGGLNFESGTFLVMDGLDITDVYLLVELASKYLPTYFLSKILFDTIHASPKLQNKIS